MFVHIYIYIYIYIYIRIHSGIQNWFMWLWGRRSPVVCIICILKLDKQECQWCNTVQTEDLKTSRNNAQRRKKMDVSAQTERANPSFLSLFFSCVCAWGWSPPTLVLIQMLISSRNILTCTTRNSILQLYGYPLAQSSSHIKWSITPSLCLMQS
jgi:hypothetical protein